MSLLCSAFTFTQVLVCCVLIPPVSVCTYQTQADWVDVDVPNSDGVTALMLAVRDVDLFEGIATPLPWEYRPVEVAKELLGLSA